MYADRVLELREHAPGRGGHLHRTRLDEQQRADHQEERQRVGEERGAGSELGQHEAGQRGTEAARAPVNCMAFSRTALTIASGGTSWGTYACHAAMVMPAPMAPTTTQATMSGGVATPVTQMPQSASAEAISTTWDRRRMVRRSWRSASAPASGPTTVDGKKVANAPTPTQTVECVSWSSTYGTVMVCIHVPEFETQRRREEEREVAVAQRRQGAAGAPGARAAAAVTGRIYR